MTAVPPKTFPGGWSVLLGVAALIWISAVISDPRMQAYAIGIVIAVVSAAQLFVGTEVSEA